MPEQKSKKNYGRSKAGVELTPEVLDRMVEEAEAGFDVSKLRRRPGRPAMGSGPADSFPVRLDPELRKRQRARRRQAHDRVRGRPRGVAPLPRGLMQSVRSLSARRSPSGTFVPVNQREPWWRQGPCKPVTGEGR